MSPSLTFFQAPVHTVAHMYRPSDSEMTPQQSYSTSGFGPYFTDDMITDVNPNSYSHEHDQNPYDKGRFDRLPSGHGSSEYEDADGHYGHTHKSMNYYTSPQLVCPRPTLPPSNFSQFSSFDWPSEAPINVYQDYSDQSSQQLENYIPYPPQAAEIPAQYSFEDEQALMSMSNVYPAAQEFAMTAPAGPSPISAHHHGDGGYIEQLFMTSTPAFARRPTQSTYSASTNIQSGYYAAHQPIPLEKHSSYSELAPNVNFMNSQARAKPQVARQESTQAPAHNVPTSTGDSIKTRSATPSLDAKKNPYALGLNGPPLTSIGRKIIPAPPTVPSDPPIVDTPSPTTKTRSSRSSRSVNEPRRPSLACTFCRERKIACGRPPEGSPDPTCNQCARRSFRCRYLDSKSTRTSLARSRSRSSSKGSSSQASPLARKRK